MVVLLAISTLAAALVPPPEAQRGDARSSTSTRPEAETSGERRHSGRLIEVAVDARGEAGPQSVRVTSGDQLALSVESPSPVEVTVPAFGLVEFAESGDPARFDLLVDRSGTFDVRSAGGGTVARIVSRDRAGD